MSAFETPANWRKSSFSQNGDCIEVACAKASIFVRDSESHPEAVLKFGSFEWRLFIAAVKSGQSNLNN